MKTIFQGLALVACMIPRASSGQEGNGLIHLVSSFSAPVSCIAPSRGDDLVSWVGLENGNVIRVNFSTDEREVISTNFNGRVYDIIEEADTLWLGVRNQGLIKYVITTGRV
ncbi:MAG: hypothetical protein LBK12_06220, partial [Odoribacteraceae bacterium]|nr:hypothetical protein [Odoribacteraceae bacterium]